MNQGSVGLHDPLDGDVTPKSQSLLESLIVEYGQDERLHQVQPLIVDLKRRKSILQTFEVRYSPLPPCPFIGYPRPVSCDGKNDLVCTDLSKIHHPNVPSNINFFLKTRFILQTFSDEINSNLVHFTVSGNFRVKLDTMTSRFSSKMFFFPLLRVTRFFTSPSGFF